MSRTYIIVETNDLSKTMKKASTTVNTHIKDAISNSVSAAKDQARVNAPVYNPAKYPHYSGMAHHHIPPGTLKASISRSPVVNVANMFATSIAALAPFASYVEGGFWHRLAKRHIRGRRFMFRAVNVVFRYKFDRELGKAIAKALETK